MKSVCDLKSPELFQQPLYNVYLKKKNNIYMVSVLGIVIKTLHVYDQNITINTCSNPRKCAVKGQENACCQVQVCHMEAAD